VSLWNRQRGIDPRFFRGHRRNVVLGGRVTVRIALRAGQIDGQMQAAGTRIALADLLIGSTSLELGFAVATANARHFGLIPKLVIKRL
jgi:predicted nucleic acid-binding protein